MSKPVEFGINVNESSSEPTGWRGRWMLWVPCYNKEDGFLWLFNLKHPSCKVQVAYLHLGLLQTCGFAYGFLPTILRGLAHLQVTFILSLLQHYTQPSLSWRETYRSSECFLFWISRKNFTAPKLHGLRTSEI
jgi:hypothetical protein